MSLAKWGRIEAHAQTSDLNNGLTAEVADPLWLLARQLQFGELVGDDGGTPVAVHVQSSWTRFTRFQADGPNAPARPVRLDASSGPVEAMVEREALLGLDSAQGSGPDDWAARVRAGRMLDRRLRDGNFAQVATLMATHAATTFTPAAPGAHDVSGAMDDRYRTLLAGRAIDAVRVLRLHRSNDWLPSDLLDGVTGARRDDLRTVLDTWSAAVDAEFGVAPADATEPDSWIPDRLEYAFRLGAPPLPGTQRELVLRASEYDGAGVEWYSLDLDTTATASVGAGAGEDASVTGTRRVNLLPTPLSYPGMPANRFWEMEDAAVALGDVSAGPTDLARMLAIDFAIVYGPDWFLAPVEVPVGSVAAIDWVVVRDTFGVATLIGTTATQAGDGVGRQFQPSDATGAEGDNPMLVVLPSSMGTLRSDTREDVALQRDETANLAWAIERIVMGPTGRGVDRPWFQSEFDPPHAVSADPFELVWRLSTPVAASWIPFVAGNDTDGTRRLIKARLLDTSTGDVRATVSRLLQRVDSIREEEVTRTGSRVTTIDQLARWYDGRAFAWRGREKRPGRGEVSSHLTFDAADPDRP
jgi:hypothetical protein